MKLCNINVDGAAHLGLVTARGLVDATAAGYPHDIDAVIAGADADALRALENDTALPTIETPKFLNVVNRPNKLLCVGMNYRAHAEAVDLAGAGTQEPTLFSKFADALAPSGAEIELPDWEDSYDYEAELVVVIGKRAWGVSEKDAEKYIFGYTCGNDLSVRAPQKYTTQWLIGKTMPGFGPCGPFIVTADSYDARGKNIRSYVNGELRQDGDTADMIHSVARIISFASHYMALEPGDLIFTGTPSGVALEKGRKLPWLTKGDRVDVNIEGIGTLTSYMA